MVTQFFLGVIFGIIDTLLNLVPVMSFSSEILTGVDSFFTMLQSIAFIFPLTAFFVFVGTVVVFYSAVYIISIVNWLIRKIPTIS